MKSSGSISATTDRDPQAVEQRRLCPTRQILIVADVGQRQRRRTRMPPGRLMVPTAMDEQVEVQLPLHRANPVLDCDD